MISNNTRLCLLNCVKINHFVSRICGHDNRISFYHILLTFTPILPPYLIFSFHERLKKINAVI